jgi:hypothetical protein
MSDRVFVFGEGKTEQTVLDNLGKYLGAGGLEPTFVGGKNNFRNKMLIELEPEFKPGMPGHYVRVLVFRDVDRGETEADLCRSFGSIARQLIDTPAQWRSVADAANVFAVDIRPTGERPGLRLVLHLAATPPVTGLPPVLPDFSDKTTDGYLLGLALSPGVVERFARDARVDATVIVQKVTAELPQLFSQNRLPLETDKDYLAAYLVATRFWKVKRNEAKERLAGIILDRATKAAAQDFCTVMHSWLCAIKEARR